MVTDRILASGANDKTIRLWEVATGTETACLKGHSNPFGPHCRVQPDGEIFPPGGVNALCKLPDGRLASAAGDGTIRMWDIATGAESACLEEHFDPVVALCVLPSGYLVSGGWDDTIRLWDITQAVEVAHCGIDSAVGCLAALRDDAFAAGDFDGKLHWLTVKKLH
jgi:WD40 repeat protein